MRKIFTTAFATLTVFFAYSQSYLPLTGGTLTGQLNGTTANFSKSTGQVVSYDVGNNGNGYIHLR